MAAVNPRRANGSLRDKVRARVLREETHCWLCGAPVDKTLPHGLPASPEVDEIVPVSKGGSPFDRKIAAWPIDYATAGEGTATQTKSDTPTCDPSKPAGNGADGCPGHHAPTPGAGPTSAVVPFSLMGFFPHGGRRFSPSRRFLWLLESI